jgi:hypothetical protein
MNGRIVCNCGRSAGSCPVHGDLVTRRIVERFGNGSLNNKNGEYYVTELCGCLKQAYFERKHAHAVTLEELWRKQVGNAFHRQLGFAFRSWTELPVRMRVKFA